MADTGKNTEEMVMSDNSGAVEPAAATEIRLPNLSGRQWGSYIELETHHVIGGLRMLSGRGVTAEDPRVPPLLDRLELYLNWLETVSLPPLAASTSARLVGGMKAILDTSKPEHQRFFTVETTRRVAALHAKITADRDGGLEASGDELDEDADEEGDANSAAASSSASGSVERPGSASGIADLPALTIRLPPKNHPIFGVGGMGMGVAIGRAAGGRKTYLLNRNFENQRRDPKVFGHNGLRVGQFFPRVVKALFDGAHGSMQGGISYSKTLGVYSILITGTYSELDADRGDIIYYSGTKSLENTSPHNIKPSHANTAMHASIRNQNPVRVLRRSGKKNRYVPRVGIRYDGLYQVVSSKRLKNPKGGLYERFELHRLPNQTSLEALIRIPNAQQIDEYDRFEEGY